ncbi:hypothetical protein FSP39_003910 [Pinctada imbricata]|uniref:Fanconi anemia core complex-associated protein 24 pseudonuclease domain-containing protein n=1 Tax=Pinctada imbricata TaxID=66713 RepID=A0AA88XVX5_PINIB|nr:hypothetical protein FSP39_003910 [Pinctada imbricata]
MFQENLGVLDFYATNNQGILYINEADMVTATGYRRKLAKLRKANKINVLVLFEKTPASTQYFPAAQKFCALELGFSVLPVPGQKQAGTILASMVHNESRLDSNPYCKKRKATSLDKAMLDTVQAIPKLGQIKARALLENFQSKVNKFTSRR